MVCFILVNWVNHHWLGSHTACYLQLGPWWCFSRTGGPDKTLGNGPCAFPINGNVAKGGNPHPCWAQPSVFPPHGCAQPSRSDRSRSKVHTRLGVSGFLPSTWLHQCRFTRTVRLRERALGPAWDHPSLLAITGDMLAGSGTGAIGFQSSQCIPVQLSHSSWPFVRGVRES